MDYKQLFGLAIYKLDSLTDRQLNHFVNPHVTERIICSAVHITSLGKYDEQPTGIERGFVVCGRRHGDCYRTIKNILNDHGKDEYSIYSMTEAKDMGFITNFNRFVNRKEALKIAMDAGQLINPELHKGKKLDDPLYILTSEDIFLDS